MSCYRVSWQDYNGWRTSDLNEPRPVVLYRDFSDRESAEREVRLRRAAGMTVCITSVDPDLVRKVRGKRPRRAFEPRMQQLFGGGDGR